MFSPWSKPWQGPTLDHGPNNFRNKIIYKINLNYSLVHLRDFLKYNFFRVINFMYIIVFMQIREVLDKKVGDTKYTRFIVILLKDIVKESNLTVRNCI